MATTSQQTNLINPLLYSSNLSSTCTTTKKKLFTHGYSHGAAPTTTAAGTSSSLLFNTLKSSSSSFLGCTSRSAQKQDLLRADSIYSKGLKSDLLGADSNYNKGLRSNITNKVSTTGKLGKITAVSRMDLTSGELKAGVLTKSRPTVESHVSLGSLSVKLSLKSVSATKSNVSLTGHCTHPASSPSLLCSQNLRGLKSQTISTPLMSRVSLPPASTKVSTTCLLLNKSSAVMTETLDKESSHTSSQTMSLSLLRSSHVCSKKFLPSTLTRSSHCQVASKISTTAKSLSVTSSNVISRNSFTSSSQNAQLLRMSEKYLKTDDEPITTRKALQTQNDNVTRPITDDTEGAAQYNFSSPAPNIPPKPSQFVSPDLDASLHSPPTTAVDVIRLKTTLLNAIAASLLASPDFHNSKDSTLLMLCSLVEKISCHDPEFVLKLAIYTRLNLNIRTTANFLVALAAKLLSCRPYLKKYFCATIKLPSDWIEVAEIYQALHDTTIKFGAIPTALRKVMGAKFTEFDAYQLAKYNKDNSKKNKNSKDREEKANKKSQKLEEERKNKYLAEYPPLQFSTRESDSNSDDSSVVLSDSENKEEIERLSFTLKQLIRKIHISDPVEHVMCLIGKKYPEDSEAFRKTRLTGTWDQDRAGKRMKLPTPETWETQVSKKGNKASTWQDLIDHKKLPFMAMLRNIRNLIIAGVSPKHHQWVMKKLGDEREVVKSKQFPFRFFSAYQVLEDMENIVSGAVPLSKPPSKGKGNKSKKSPKRIADIDQKLLQKYKTALDTALKISTCYNVKPIGGRTLILCNVGKNMDKPCTAAKGLGKPRKVLEVGILLGLMCKYSCESSTMLVYGHNGDFTKVELEDGTILHNMEKVMVTADSKNLTHLYGSLPIGFLTEFLMDRKQVDNIVLLSDTMKLDDEKGRMMMDFLQKYRHLVNPNLLFVSVDLSAGKSGVSNAIQAQHPNDIYLAGYSDQILRFIAERGDTGQLTYVDNIDRVYNLSDIKVPSLADSDISEGVDHLSSEKTFLSITRGQKWRTVRVFISSTFRDMHGERDMLTRFVFPELRSRAHSKQIHVYEVDLRWGITEHDARSQKSLEICLEEISRSQYFIGLLGQRYGWVQEEYNVSNTPDFDWLKHFPKKKSITEVEMYHAALSDADKAVKKASFYFRDPSFLNKVPSQFKEDFESESEEAMEKIEALKSKIRESGLEVYDNYSCCWLGKVLDRPMVGGLESFGQRVLHTLWNAIQRDYSQDDIEEDAITQSTAQHYAFEEARASTFIGRRTLLQKAKDAIENPDNRLVFVTGKPGCGKSAFMAALSQEYTVSRTGLSVNLVLSHFVGAAPGSSNVALLLTRLCHEMKRRFGVTKPVPEDYTDLARDWVNFIEDSVVNLRKMGSKIVIMIDGVDLLEDKHNGCSLDWIPSKIPEGAMILISGVEGGACATNLRKRQPLPAEVTIGHLDMFDRAEMVRKKLEKYRKKLDESPFNNQMKLLLTKKEAINPLYLHLACEELRVFGVFEEVTSYLRKMPPTISSLLQEVLQRLECELTPEIVSTALLILTLVRNGLLEHELAGVLELAIKDLCSEEAWSLPPMMISKLLRSLQTFLQPTGQEELNLLILAHKDIEKAVKLRYMRGAKSIRGGKLHLLLSKFFLTEVDPAGDRSFKGNSARAFVELPYHLKEGSAWKELEELVCNINFVVAKCQLGRAHELLEDYMPTAVGLQAGKASELNKFIQQPAVQEFKSFVSRNLHILLHNPSLALQQALNEPITSAIAHSAKDLAKESHSMMVWLNKPDTISPCQMNISSAIGSVLCVDVSLDSTLFAAGFKNGAVKVYETATGKEVHTFIGHAAGIADVCFVSSDLVCSASHDATLSLWQTKQGIRVASMRGHNRGVYGCAANKSGKIIVSVSWDTSIKVWERTGKLQSTLKTQGQHNTPINCVSFHPEGQLIVVGSWDGLLKIWDTFNQKRLKVLRGHKTSVQACAYGPSGRHIVSASLDGEVKVWSTKSGTAVGTITGHHSSINSIAFTQSGKYLVTGSNDKVVKVWSGTMGQPVTSIGAEELGFVHRLVFNHKTQLVGVGYNDGHVRQFNLQTGAEVFSIRPHQAAIVGLAHHTSLFMSASADGSMKVWDTDSPHKAIKMKGHSSSITCAVWDRNGFASASEDFTIMIWPHDINIYSRKLYCKPKSKKDKKKKQPTLLKGKELKLEEEPLFKFQGQHTGTITSIAFSCDGLRMAVTGHDRMITLWDCLSHKLVKTLNNCHKDWITACSFSDTCSDMLITGSTDFTLKMWDLTSGAERITFKGHMSAINAVSFSHGCVVSSAFDGSVKVWTHKGVEITTMFCHKQRVNTCCLHIPGGAQTNQIVSSWADVDDADANASMVKLEEIIVLTGSDDGTVGVWKPFLPNEIATLTGHSDHILSVATMLNNNVLSSSLDGSIRMWKFPLPESGLSLVSTFKGHIGPITSLSGLSVGEELSYAVSGGRDGHISVWMIEGCGFKKLYQVRDSATAVSSVCLTNITSDSNSGEFAVGSDVGALRIYSFSQKMTPKMDACVRASNLMGVHSVAKIVQGPDCKNIVIGSWSTKIAVVGSKRVITHHMDMHKDWVMDLITVGQYVYSIGLDGNLIRWEMPISDSLPSGIKFPLHLDPAGEKDSTWLLSLCEVKGTSYIAISDSKGQVSLWNKDTMTVEVTKKLHTKQVNVVLSLSDSCFLSGSDDSTIKVWMVQGRGRNISLTQIGQFYGQSCITAIASVGGFTQRGKNCLPMFVFGDSLGNVNLLQWQQ